ncbi:MAG: hypothetical protein M1832_002746 [Thelocarpon impressellum]|nr:MAG: hypothetical protein M1832_002746 [Thelocarpon impressellum]
MATTTPSSPPGLSFPPATYAKLSPGPFLLAHLQSSSSSTGAEPLRPNGRRPREGRPPTIHTGSLSHADGSAVVRAGDTAVVCGVRAEVLRADDTPGQHHVDLADDVSSASAEARALGLLVPNIELSTGCAPAHLPGQPPSALAQTLTARLLSLLQSAHMVDARALRIWHTPPASSSPTEPAPEIKAYWTLYIDILFISLDGSAFDAAWAATVAALSDTRLPHAWWDVDYGSIVCSDAVSASHPLPIHRAPFACTFAIPPPSPSGHPSSPRPLLVDPDALEEATCPGTLTLVLAVNRDVDENEIWRVERSGNAGPDDVGQLREALSVGRERSGVWSAAWTKRSRN